MEAGVVTRNLLLNMVSEYESLPLLNSITPVDPDTRRIELYPFVYEMFIWSIIKDYTTQ